MSRPTVELANFEAVYDYYESHVQSRVFARTAHVVLARRYRVSVSCDDGVEDAIADGLRAGSRLVLSPNHLTADDQYVVVAFAQELPVLRPLRGRAFIPSEPSLFSRPGISGKILRMAVDGLGAIPTFRLEDLRRQGIEMTEEIELAYQRSIVRASETQVAQLVRGCSMAGFWEGTRNRIDYRVVQPLRKGIGHTAIAAAKEVPVLLVPMGMYYGGEPSDYQRPRVPEPRAPRVHVGMPIPVDTTNADDLVGLLHPEIQRCVDHVVAEVR